jgi:hypothetical protein
VKAKRRKKAARKVPKKRREKNDATKMIGLNFLEQTFVENKAFKFKFSYKLLILSLFFVVVGLSYLINTNNKYD